MKEGDGITSGDGGSRVEGHDVQIDDGEGEAMICRGEGNANDDEGAMMARLTLKMMLQPLPLNWRCNCCC